jgi:hypothetical protein
MDETEYRDYMKKIRKQTPEQIEKHVARIKDFEKFLNEKFKKNTDTASLEEMIHYMEKFETKEDEVFLEHQFSIYQYYRSMYNQYFSDELHKLMCERTGQERYIFEIKKFKGVDKDNIKKLIEHGIINIEDVHEATKSAKRRKELAAKTKLPEEWILKLSKLSDLARIAGLKGTRSLLYYDAGVETLEEIATWDPVQLREHFIDFYEITNYQGAKPPTQKECNNHVRIAKSLPNIIEF